MFYKMRALKNIAIVLLIAFSITFALPVNVVNAVNQLSNSQPISVSNNLNDNIISTLPSNDLNGQLQKNFQKLEQYINYADKTQFQNSVVESRQIIHTLKKQMLDELDNNQTILEQLNAGTALERNRKFRQNLEKQFNDLN